tara:strand:+ start:3345 stop:3596 length:252 start_codon:yes stop_codon:yes gene_type:complete
MKDLPYPPPQYDQNHMFRIQETIQATIEDETVQKRQDLDMEGKAASDSSRATFLGRLILLSPNGTKFQLLVDNSGNLSTSSTI